MVVKSGNPRSIRQGALLTGFILVLAGCGERPPEKIAQENLVAKVNGREITRRQMDSLLRGGEMPARSSESVKKQLLEQLIDQELAVQKALDSRLERNLSVVDAIENSRREILARAYVEQAAGMATRPAPEDVRKFHAAHPELFAARKVYRLEEYAFPASHESMEMVREQLRAGKAPTEIMAALRGSGIDALGGISVKPAEQLPLEILPRLAAAREGQPLLFEVKRRAALITVLGVKAEPLDAGKSLAFAEEYLMRMERNQMVSNAIKGMRDMAKIEYFGEFSSVNLALGEVAGKTAGGLAIRQEEKGGQQ